MKVEEVAIPGLFLLTAEAYRDERGFFVRTFEPEAFAETGVDPFGFVQDSLSRSRAGVVRGLHLRTGYGEGKLVRCSHGAIFDVVVDLRPGSPTFATWQSFTLDGDSQASIFIPPGCAHGFQALTETADTSYRITRPHDPSEDLTIRYSDPDLAIPWPLPVEAVSGKDAAAPPLREQSEAIAAISPSGWEAALH